MPILLTSLSPHHPQPGRPIPRPDSLPSVDPVSPESAPFRRLPASIHSHPSSSSHTANRTSPYTRAPRLPIPYSRFPIPPVRNP